MMHTTPTGLMTESVETLAEVLDAGIREWEDHGGALLPILLRHISGTVRPAAEVRAEALREAADAGPSSTATDQLWRMWLRDRAALAAAEPAPRCAECGPGYRIGDEGCRHGTARPMSEPECEWEERS